MIIALDRTRSSPLIGPDHRLETLNFHLSYKNGGPADPEQGLLNHGLYELEAYRNRMNSVAAKENLLKQVIWFSLNVFSTRFFYLAANSFADIKIP